MKKIVQTIVLCLISSQVLASEPNYPNLVGDWVGISNSAVLGPDKHHLGVTAEEVQFRHKQFTFSVKKQDGRNFAGENISSSASEPFVGAIRVDRKSGYFVDTDGIMEFQLVTKNQMELCYIQPQMNGTSMVASCFQLNRK